jgi:hypothetical protein
LLRQQDIPWFHSDLAFHEKQIFQLIQDYVFEAEFPALAQLFRNSTPFNTAPNPPPSKLGATDCDTKNMTRTKNNNNKGNGEVIVGINNLKQLQKKKNQELKTSAARVKKKGKLQKSNNAGVIVSSGDDNNSDQRNKISDNDNDNNNNIKRVADCYKPDVTILFGETLQITYRMEETPTGSLTLLYKNATSTSSDEVDNTATGEKKKKKRKQRNTLTTDVSFRALKALPKRLVLWCYPFDQNSPTKPNPQDSGFPRPEMIPLTSLFQPPRQTL